MSKYMGVPVSAAKKIAKDCKKQQVIVVCWDEVHKKTHVTTYGDTVDNCDRAAKGGDFVKQALGWPKKLCNTEPPRVKALRKQVEKLKAELAACS